MNPRKGDTVRLAQSVTTAEFGLAFCDNDGAGLEIDGVVVEAVPHMVNACFRRLIHHSRITGPTEGTVSSWVRRHEVLEVIKGEARLWPNAAGLKAVSDECEGKVKRQPEPVFWTVGVDEIPGT